jgi:hypothetical protein
MEEFEERLDTTYASKTLGELRSCWLARCSATSGPGVRTANTTTAELSDDCMIDLTNAVGGARHVG